MISSRTAMHGKQLPFPCHELSNIANSLQNVRLRRPLRQKLHPCAIIYTRLAKPDGFRHRIDRPYARDQPFFELSINTKNPNIMKTKHNTLSTIYTTTRATLLVILLSMVTWQCAPSKSEQGENQAPDTDIHTAVVTGNKEALLQHIKAGSDINEKDPFGGSSPLISAAVFGKTEEAKILIDAGADLNFQNNDGSTALHSAAFFCRPEIVRMLLDKNADKNVKNKFGATPYESVAVPFVDVRETYDMMEKMLGPMGLKFDYAYIEKTRPEIADMLK